MNVPILLYADVMTNIANTEKTANEEVMSNKLMLKPFFE